MIAVGLTSIGDVLKQSVQVYSFTLRSLSVSCRRVSSCSVIVFWSSNFCSSWMILTWRSFISTRWWWITACTHTWQSDL